MPQAFRLTLPILMGYVPLGMAFALTWTQQGLPWWAAIVASIVLYAGSMQFLLVGLLAAGVDLTAVLLATLAVNLRHIFYGLSFPSAAFQGRRLALGYAMFALTDEGYSVTTQISKTADWRLITQVLLLCHSYWILGTLLGVIAAWLIPPQIIGFDFALAALFTVLAQNHFYYPERRPALALGFIGIIAALLAVHWGGMSSRQTLALAIGILLLLLLILPRRLLLGQGGSHE